MRIMILISAVLAASEVFLFIVNLSKMAGPDLIISAYRSLVLKTRRSAEGSSWYKKTEKIIKANGGIYHFGKWINPFSYLTMQIVISCVCFFVVGNINLVAAVILGYLGYKLPYILLIYMNANDNKKLLPDIKLIYNSLEIQIKAGVYITDALAECYSSVHERRLKQALLDLAGCVVVKGDIFRALGEFQDKFNNSYIDSLCITLLQALESGQAVELLSDISDQIKDMEKMVLEKRKNSLDRSITFYQLGMLIALMILVLYACITRMYSAAINF